MGRVHVTEDVAIFPNEVSSVLYPAGFEGVAPSAHIDAIVAAGKGRRVEPKAERPEKRKADETAPAEPAGAAEA